MSLVQSIFKIHSHMLAKSDQETADEYLRILINEKVSELQSMDKFNPKSLELIFKKEAESFANWDKKKSS